MSKAPRFYVNGPYLEDGGLLPAAVFHHAVTVRRLHSNDALTIFNGDGQEQNLRLRQVQKKTATVSALPPSAGPAPHPKAIHLGIASIQQLDWALQKATELGADKITILTTERSQGIHTAQLEKKIDHWQGVIIAACEQSGRCTLPQLHALTPIQDFILTAPVNTVVLEPTATQNFATARADIDCLLIGPEGGFSAKELDLCQNAGIRALRLGASVLRAETAALAALSLVLLNESN